MADTSPPRMSNWLALRNMEWEDAFRFFMHFSAMEYALKHAGFLEHQEDQPWNTSRRLPDWIDAQADWKAFGRAVDRDILGNNSLETGEMKHLHETQRALQVPPPQSYKRKIGTDEVGWKNNRLDQDGPEICRTIQCMKYVRNNLFHGEKSPMIARDKELIQQCIVLIDILVKCCWMAHNGPLSDELRKLLDVHDHYRRVIG